MASTLRGQGIGKLIFAEAIRRAKERGCKLAQLTTNKIRKDALAFYQSLGFEATHEGLKIKIK